MSELNIGTIKLPPSSVTKTMAILAKRGAGKTYTAAVFAEELFKIGAPFVVFDPIDVWWGLRFDKNGKDEGLPVVVFGIEHADIKLTRDMGVQIAQAVVKHNISCVISTFGMPKVAQRQLIQEFSEEILRINDTPRNILIEEAHEFIPQRVYGALGKCFAAVEALVVMGRNRGIGVTVINQRAATINKDILTQIDTLMAFRNVAPQDRKALSEWVEHHAAEGDFDKFMQSLPSLPTGEGWIWSPEFLNIFKKFKVRKRETFHPDREKVGSQVAMPELASIDVQSFVEEFGKLAKAKPAAKGAPSDDQARTNKAKAAPEESAERAYARVVVEMEQLKANHESEMVTKDLLVSELMKKLRLISNIAGVLEVPVEITGSPMTMPHLPVGQEHNLMLQKLGGMARTIYETLLRHTGGLTKQQLGLMCSYAPSSGGFRNALSKLRTMGLITKNGETYTAKLM